MTLAKFGTMGLAFVRIVLVEPAGPLNVGSVARVMKNMGLHHLVLVNPQCDRLSAEARQMAVHADDVLESATEVSTLPEALHGCQRAIATTGYSHITLNTKLEHPRLALPWLLEQPDLDQPILSALIFGREDRGLTIEELNYAQRLIHIPANPAYSSLNLAQAVALCCYELYTLAIQPDPSNPKTENREEPGIAHLPEKPSISYADELGRSPVPNLASLDELEGYYQHLESLLLKIGYLYPHTAASRMEKFRQLFNRAYPSTTEVAMLRGILSQVEWALDNKQKQSD